MLLAFRVHTGKDGIYTKIDCEEVIIDLDKYRIQGEGPWIPKGVEDEREERRK